MTPKRIALVELAFKKMDKSGDGVISVDDIRGTYDVRFVCN